MIQYSVLGEPFFFDPVSTGFSLEEIELNWSEKTINHFKEALLRETKITSYSFCINVSDACNLSCDYCFNQKKSGRILEKQTAISELERLFKKYPSGEKYYIDMSGAGEPLLALGTVLAVSKWCKEKQNAIRREVLPQFVCNGTLLSPRIANLLQNHGILFGVSLDGNQFVHDKHRRTKFGEPTYSQILSTIKNISDRQYIGCAATLTDDVFSLTETIEELSRVFNTVSFRPARVLFGRNKNALMMWMFEYEKLAKKLLGDLSQNNCRFFFLLMNGEDFFGRQLTRAFGGLRVLRRCDAGISRIYVGMGGKDYICPAAASEKEETITSLLGSQPLPNTSCHECPFRLICGGECAIELAHNDGKPREALCQFKRHLILLANYIERVAHNDFPILHASIRKFAKEKEARNREDPQLRRFLDTHPDLSFTEAKKQFDEIVHRY